MISKFPYLAMNNKILVDSSNQLGCYHCLNIFPKEEIKEYTDEGKTVICPHCKHDTIISDSSVVSLNKNILEQANQFWFHS